jgi:hypothetical protein
MTDLLLEDLENPTGEGMVQILSYEKGEMLGEQRAAADKGAVHSLCLSRFAGSFSKVKKGRFSRWPFRRFRMRKQMEGRNVAT